MVQEGSAVGLRRLHRSQAKMREICKFGLLVYFWVTELCSQDVPFVDTFSFIFERFDSYISIVLCKCAKHWDVP